MASSFPEKRTSNLTIFRKQKTQSTVLHLIDPSTCKCKEGDFYIGKILGMFFSGGKQSDFVFCRKEVVEQLPMFH